MRSKLFFSIVFIFLVHDLSAQAYMTAVGARIGDSFGLTVNQRVLKRMTVEGVFQNHFRTRDTYLHLLAKQHKSLISRRLNFYGGGGIHMGVQNEGGSLAGVDAILGLEFSVDRFNISADFKPQWTFGQGMILNQGISIRYVILKDTEFRKWSKKRKKAKRKKNKTPFWERI